MTETEKQLLEAAPDMLAALLRIIAEDTAGEISIGAIEDAKNAAKKARVE